MCRRGHGRVGCSTQGQGVERVRKKAIEEPESDGEEPESTVRSQRQAKLARVCRQKPEADAGKEKI